MNSRWIYGLALALCLVSLSLAGCSTTTKVSADEQANWKGGPMPADFKVNVGSGPPKTASPAKVAAAPSPK